MCPSTGRPGYTFLLAGAYAVLGQSAAAAEALNILFAIATGLIILELARGLYGAQAGAIALLLYALWPAGALMTTVRIPHTRLRPRLRGRGLGGGGQPAGLEGQRPRWRRAGPVAVPATHDLRAAAGLHPRPRLGSTRAGAARSCQAIVPIVLAFLLVLVPIMAWHLSTRGVLDISTSAYGGSSLYHGTNRDSGGRWSEAASRELTRIAGREQWERTQDRSAAGHRPSAG